jgi:hypothetical protein
MQTCGQLAREPLAYVDELETDALKKSTAWWRVSLEVRYGDVRKCESR